MAKQNRTTLKGYFETGDIPSQAQNADLIDSNLNIYSKKLTEIERDEIISGMWKNYGKTFIEYIFLNYFKKI